MKINETTNVFGEEDEFVLTPKTKPLEEAEKIAKSTQDEQKFSFLLHYEADQKEFLLSMLQAVGANVENDNEESHAFLVSMNMTQLAFIKSLDCLAYAERNKSVNPILEESIQQELNQMTISADIEVESAEAKVVTPIALEDDVSSNTTAAASTLSMARSSCDTCPDNNSMETAQVVSDEGYTSGNITCPGGEQWFQFTATQTRQYTMYTTSSLDTVGTLYDSCGNMIAQVDDHTPTGELDFRIVASLTAGATYYLKVRLLGFTTGSYSLRITKAVLAERVTISKSTISLESGVTYELPVTPNYTYKGYNGAQPIPGLSVSIYPSNASEQKIWWSAEDSDILSFSYGWDDDNNRYIHVSTVCDIETELYTKLYAEDWLGNGATDSCDVTVFSIPEVEITKSNQGNYSVIRFIYSSTNTKEWHSVDEDVIGRSYDIGDSALNDRVRFNCYIDPTDILSDMRTYTDEELKLLYALDPHGVSYYVKRYAKELGGVADGVEYKDRIFRLLFNRNPKYFVKLADERWVERDTYTDPEAVYSESESYFGFRDSMLTGSHKAEVYLRFATNLTLTALSEAPIIGQYISTIQDLVSLATCIFADGTENAIDNLSQYLLESSFDSIADLIPIDWVSEMVSYCMTVADVAQHFSNQETYSVKLIEYCADKVPFKVSVKMGNTFYEMKNIEKVVKAVS